MAGSNQTGDPKPPCPYQGTPQCPRTQQPLAPTQPFLFPQLSGGDIDLPVRIDESPLLAAINLRETLNCKLMVVLKDADRDGIRVSADDKDKVRRYFECDANITTAYIVNFIEQLRGKIHLRVCDAKGLL